MKRFRHIFLLLLPSCLLMGLITHPLLYASENKTQDVREAYEATVLQLRKDGYKGIGKALVSFNEILKKDPKFLSAHISAADALLLKYEFSKKKDPAWLRQALEHLDICIRQEPDFFVAYFKRAILYFNLNRPDKAVEDIKTALKLYPTYLEARILYLQYLLAGKKLKEATSFADSSLKHFPKDPAPLKFFGDIFFKARVYPEAIRYYKGVLTLVPNAPYTHLALGKIYQDQDKLDLAIKNYQKAIEQAPDLYEAHFNLGYCYSRKNDLEKAIHHLEIYAKKFPDDISVLNNLALLYERSGQIRKAKLAWLKTKEKAKDKTYRKRAETHLYRLIHRDEKAKPKRETSHEKKP